MFSDWDEGDRSETARILTKLNESLVEKFAQTQAQPQSDDDADTKTRDA